MEKVLQAIQEHDQETLDYAVQQAQSLCITDRPEIIQGIQPLADDARVA